MDSKRENMTELEEYQKCLDDIELYRAKREDLDRQLAVLKAQLSDLQKNNSNAAISSLLDQINAIKLQDEKYGAIMHGLAIKRNLLEP